MGSQVFILLLFCGVVENKSLGITVASVLLLQKLAKREPANILLECLKFSANL